MQRIAYVNGVFGPIETANVSILDRGFLFADGVYEVTAVLDGRLVDFEAHAARLRRSLAEIALPNPVDDDALRGLHDALIARNGLQEGLIYLQVTRGAAEREFGFPVTATPSIVLFTQAKTIVDAPSAALGVKVASTPDLRWARRDIKSVALLAQVLAKQAAIAAGAQEAWMVEDGFVTEGASSTAFIVTADALVTRPLSQAVLPGITRRAVLALLEQQDLRLDERPFTLAEAMAAREAFITSATAFVTPVVSIDGRAIGDGRPGPATQMLRKLYIEAARG